MWLMCEIGCGALIGLGCHGLMDHAAGTAGPSGAGACYVKETGRALDEHRAVAAARVAGRTARAVKECATCADCNGAANIMIPASVTAIGEFAFQNCTSLVTVTVPDSVQIIGKQAFRCCSSLSIITIPDSVEAIGDLAFAHCTSLGTVTIPTSVKSTGSQAFYNIKCCPDSDCGYKAGTFVKDCHKLPYPPCDVSGNIDLKGQCVCPGTNAKFGTCTTSSTATTTTTPTTTTTVTTTTTSTTTTTTTTTTTMVLGPNDTCDPHHDACDKAQGLVCSDQSDPHMCRHNATTITTKTTATTTTTRTTRTSTTTVSTITTTTTTKTTNTTHRSTTTATTTTATAANITTAAPSHQPTSVCTDPDPDQCANFTAALCSDITLGPPVVATCPVLCSVCDLGRGPLVTQDDGNGDGDDLVVVIIVVICAVLCLAFIAVAALVHHGWPKAVGRQDAGCSSMAFTNNAFVAPTVLDGDTYDEIGATVVAAPATYEEIATVVAAPATYDEIAPAVAAEASHDDFAPAVKEATYLVPGVHASVQDATYLEPGTDAFASAAETGAAPHYATASETNT